MFPHDEDPPAVRRIMMANEDNTPQSQAQIADMERIRMCGAENDSYIMSQLCAAMGRLQAKVMAMEAEREVLIDTIQDSEAKFDDLRLENEKQAKDIRRLERVVEDLKKGQSDSEKVISSVTTRSSSYSTTTTVSDTTMESDSSNSENGLISMDSMSLHDLTCSQEHLITTPDASPPSTKKKVGRATFHPDIVFEPQLTLNPSVSSRFVVFEDDVSDAASPIELKERMNRLPSSATLLLKPEKISRAPPRKVVSL